MLVHGITNYGLSWFPQIAPLVYNGFKVILLDLPGHGLSSPVHEDYTVNHFSSDVFELLDFLEIETFSAVGLSLGGMIVQEMALRQPRRLHRIVVANSTPYFTDDDRKYAVQSWVKMFRQENGPQLRLKKNWGNLVHLNLQNSTYGKFIYENWQQVLKHNTGESFAHIAIGMLEFDVRKQLHQINVPSLIITSTDDKQFFYISFGTNE